MVVSSNIQKCKYTSYTNKNTKLARDVRDGKLIKIKKDCMKLILILRHII